MTATASGPITGGKRGWPFGEAIVDLAARGYVEEEFFFEGVAPRYRPIDGLGTDGAWNAERASESPYVTRALVRRPTDPARFNGTVIVEWNNVSAGLEIFDAGDTPVIFEEGFAYVGVSAQRVGVEGFDADPQGLRAWDPERYGSLHIEDDGLSYGIFGEVARAVGPNRSTSPVDPLGGLKVQKILGIGGSQSAGRLVTYINAMQPLENMFDGFVPFTWFGSGFSITDPSPLDLSRGLGSLTVHPTRIRADLAVPVIVVNTECETLSCSSVRQDDTDTFRFWEVSGAPHAPRLHMERISAKLKRDAVVMPAELDPAMLIPVPWSPVLDAAIAHAQQWINGGNPPPKQAPIELDRNPVRIRRDEDGNAIGGVRVPEQEVTLSKNVGSMEESGAGLMGTWTLLPTETIRARYKDEDEYVSRVEAAAKAAVAEGVLRQVDADDSVRRAREVTLP